MRKMYKVTLTTEERAELKSLVSTGKFRVKKSNVPISCSPSMKPKTDESSIRREEIRRAKPTFLKPHAYCEIRYTPKHGSCLNVAEIELGVLMKQCLHRRMRDIETYCRNV